MAVLFVVDCVNLLECLVKVVTHTIQQFNRATCYSGHWSIPTIPTRMVEILKVSTYLLAPPPSYPLLCMLFHTHITYRIRMYKRRL